MFLALRKITFYCKFANTDIVAFVPNWETAIVSELYRNVWIPNTVAVAVKRHFRSTKSYRGLEWQE